MATVEESHAHDGPATHDGDSRNETTQSETLKRKASIDDKDGSPKRARYSNDYDAPPRRRDSSSSRRDSRDEISHANHDRRKLASTQEERKRGKRLFGGLLSTLSQTTGNSQQKRRQEIERRQQERLQKQQAEDDKVRAEKLSRLRDIRMAEQITFDEEVMRNKHSKMLAMARYLRTRSRPHIYYLPWKLTADQEDEIDEQIRGVKVTIARELESFKGRKERHIREYGEPKRALHQPEPDAFENHAEKIVDKEPQDDKTPEHHEKPSEKDHHHSHHHNHSHHHDESADVLEEADEDMVIY